MGLETFFSPSVQCIQFFCAVVIGIGLGVFWDFFRAFRIIIPHKSYFVVIEDVIFIQIWALILLIYSVEVGLGEIRFFYLLGNILGFGIYLATVGQAVTAIIGKVIGVLKWALHCIYEKILVLVAVLFKNISKKTPSNSEKNKKNHKFCIFFSKKT